jgi:hypothetical protein
MATRAVRPIRTRSNRSPRRARGRPSLRAVRGTRGISSSGISSSPRLDLPSIVLSRSNIAIKRSTIQGNRHSDTSPHGTSASRQETVPQQRVDKVGIGRDATEAVEVHRETQLRGAE